MALSQLASASSWRSSAPRALPRLKSLNCRPYVNGVGGSTLWWCTLTTIVGYFHAKIDASVMKWINHISGGLVAASGVVVLGYLIF